MSRIMAEKKLGAGRMVAVAIENNKTSQYAAKWAVDNLVPKDQCILLLHVRQRASSIPTTSISFFHFSLSLAFRQHKHLIYRVFVITYTHLQMETWYPEYAAIILFLFDFSFFLLQMQPEIQYPLIRTMTGEEHTSNKSTTNPGSFLPHSVFSAIGKAYVILHLSRSPC